MPDVHIEVLRFAKDNPGFGIDQLRAKFPNDFDWILREYEHGKLFQTSENISLASSRFYLSFEDRFRLLEYDELREARRSSRTAMYFASFSILLTIVLTIIGYAVSYHYPTNVHVTNTCKTLQCNSS